MTVIDIERDFFEVYPEFKVQSIFRECYEKNQMIIWYSIYVYGKQSPYKNLIKKEIIDILETEYFTPGFYAEHKDLIEQCGNVIRGLEETPIMRHLRIWNQKLNEKTEFLEGTVYNADTFTIIDTMLLNNEKLFKVYRQLREEYLKEEADGGAVEGNAIESLSETGEI